MGDITVRSPQNIYQYAPRNLIIAYGSAAIIAVAFVLVGYVCIWSASNSFGTSFSTILRTTRNPELDALVPCAETSGAEPLSKHLEKTKLLLRRHRGDMGDVEGVTAFTIVQGELKEETPVIDIPYGKVA
jgi:hypothetical protein